MRNKLIITVIAVAAIIGLSSCSSCEYVSDTAKQASETAHSSEGKNHPSRIRWYPKTQVSDGKRLIETGTLDYGCHTIMMPHLVHVGKSFTTITTPITSCDAYDVSYTLIYDINGNVIKYAEHKE